MSAIRKIRRQIKNTRLAPWRKIQRERRRKMIAEREALRIGAAMSSDANAKALASIPLPAFPETAANA